MNVASFAFIVLAFSILATPIYIYEKLVNAKERHKSAHAFTFLLFIAFTIFITTLSWLLDYGDLNFILFIPPVVYFSLYIPVANIFLFFKIKKYTKKSLYKKIIAAYLFVAIATPIALFGGLSYNLFELVDDGIGMYNAAFLSFFLYVAIATAVGIFIINPIVNFVIQKRLKS